MMQPAAAAAAPCASPEGRRFALQDLQQARETSNFQGMDPKRLEDYLDEGQFVATFGVGPADFGKQPVWKQAKAKKAVGIF